MNGHRIRCLRRSRAVAAAVLAILVAACSSSSSPSTAPASSAGNTTGGTYGVAKGNLSSLTWDLPYGEPNTIDPPNTAFYNSALIAANLCDPLLRLNPNYSISPNVASYRQPNPLTLVFNLRRGGKFWDGAPGTPADGGWSLQHSPSPATAVAFLYPNLKRVNATGAPPAPVTFDHPS